MSIANSWIRLSLILGMIGSSAPICLSQQASDESPEVSQYELMVQYARTNKELAEVELESAIDLNRKHPGTIAKLAIERLQSNLTVATEQLEQAQIASTGGSERIRVRHAEENIRLAGLDLQAAKKLREQGALSDLEWKRLQLKYELATLKLLVLRNPQNFSTLIDSMHAKLNRFGDEILALDQRISKLESVRGIPRL